MRLRASAYLAVLPQLIRQSEERKAYQIYMTEALWAIPNGKAMAVHYRELIAPQQEETRTPEEVISDMKQKLASL